MRWTSLSLATLVLASCAQVQAPEREELTAAYKTSASQRALRRAYDGAPPVIPHETFSTQCVECHNTIGVAVAGLGFAPPSPHETTTGLSATSRCRQCHVEQTTTDTFVANDFEGLRQDLRHGRRLDAQAPPVMPHPRFMRENCVACHSGLAAREQIRTPHPERVRCGQCHVEQITGSSFEPT